MNAQQIPMSATAPWFSQQTELQGVLYTLEFVFNVRAMRWMMSIADADSNPIALNLPLVINRNLTAGVSDARMPSGFFACFDMTTQDNQPTLSSFATTHKLFFVEQ